MLAGLSLSGLRLRLRLDLRLRGRRVLVVAALLATLGGAVVVPAAVQAPPATATAAGYSDAVVTVPMVFPVLGGARWSDTWLACRGRACSRKHLGQDLFAPKGTPVLATFDGVVSRIGIERGASGTYLSVTSDDGAWMSTYVHLDNDTPGTDDGRGGRAWAIAPGIAFGVHVRAGQHLGWLGDSGNAENTGSHIHFGLRSAAGQDHNPAPSLRAAEIRGEGLDMKPRPPVTARPRGSFDGAGLLGNGEVRLRGWAADPNSTPTSVQVLRDGRELLVAVADGDRPDLPAMGLPASSGYDVAVPLGSPGPHELCVRALDTMGGPSTLLGCQTFAEPMAKKRSVRAA